MARKTSSQTQKKASKTPQETTTTELATTEVEVVSELTEKEKLDKGDRGNETQEEDALAPSKAVKAEIVSEEEKEEETKPLTKEERARFTELEAKTLTALGEAQKSLLSAAQSLREIRDEKLFREDYPTFEEYCEKKLGFSKRFINYQINYAQVVDNFQQWEHPVPILPSSESQVRSLGSLKPEVQPLVWLKAVEIADGNVPSREIVTEVVRNYREEQKQQQQPKTSKGKKRTIEVDDCIRIKGIPSTELSAFKNWWGFVKNITDDGFEVELPHITITGVKVTDLILETVAGQPLNKQQTETRRKIFEKLAEIYTLKNQAIEEDRESQNEELLEFLLSYFVTLKTKERLNKEKKKTKSVKLTPLEEKVLNLIENEVKNEDKA